MVLNLTTEQYKILIQLVNKGLYNIPDNELTDGILSVVTLVNQAAVINPELE
jgi:hypothetical protein